MAPQPFQEENKLPEDRLVLEESSIYFSFSRRQWLVRRYDRHTYFRGLSGAGLKGVDFIGIFKSRELALIEVKNYRTGVDGRRSAFVEARLSNPYALAVSLAAKMRDTFRAIDIIHQYLQRNWTYRLLRPLLKWMPGLAPDWHFWTQAYQLSKANQVRFICWMHTNEVHQSVFEEIEQHAAALLPSAFHPLCVWPPSENPFSPDLEIYCE